MIDSALERTRGSIDSLFSDKTVSMSRTLERMEELRDLIEDNIAVLKEELNEARDEELEG